jgi:Bifunctional DNA primase/polymerase, N-terminal
LGRPVFPCCPWDGAFLNYKGEPIDAKAPLVRNGWKDATTDLDQVSTWWARFQYAMIGSPVAPDELCLDIDPRSGGDRWALVDLAGIAELPITRMVLSGRYDGGHHLFYQRPPGQLTDVRLPAGIDIRVGGKHYTILPPSVHDQTGGAYLWRWSPDAPAAPLPDEIAALLVPVAPQRTAVTTRTNEATSGRLAAICRKVAATPPGTRQTIGFTWAAKVLKEAGYGPAAWDAVADAMRDAGATEHDVRTALRERPGGERVHA